MFGRRPRKPYIFDRIAQAPSKPLPTTETFDVIAPNRLKSQLTGAEKYDVRPFPVGSVVTLDIWTGREAL